MVAAATFYIHILHKRVGYRERRVYVAAVDIFSRLKRFLFIYFHVSYLKQIFIYLLNFYTCTLNVYIGIYIQHDICIYKKVTGVKTESLDISMYEIIYIFVCDGKQKIKVKSWQIKTINFQIKVPFDNDMNNCDKALHYIIICAHIICLCFAYRSFGVI